MDAGDQVNEWMTDGLTVLRIAFNTLITFTIEDYIKLNANHYRYKFSITRSFRLDHTCTKDLFLSLFSSK